MIRPILLLSALILLAAGCDPDVNQDWAKETVQRHEATIKAIEAELTSAYAELDPAQLYLAQGDDRAQRQEAFNARSAAFEKRVSAALAKEPLLIGYTLHYTVPKLDDPPIHYGLGALTNKTPPLRPGRVIRPDKGKLDVSGKKVGWGFYQIPGKESQKVGGVIDRRMFYPGVEIVDTLEHNDTTLHYTLFLLEQLPQE